MATNEKQFLDYAGLSAYDEEIKKWSNSEEQVAYKSVLKSVDGNKLLFYKKAGIVDNTVTADKEVELGSEDTQTQLDALATIITATYDSQNQRYSIMGLNTTSQDTLVGAINELLSKIGNVSNLDVALDGETNPTNLVAAANLLADHIAAVAQDIADLDGTATIATVDNGVVTIKGGVKQIAGEIENKTTAEAADVTLAKVATTGAAEDVTIADADNKITATNVEGALTELATAIENTLDAGKVTVETANGETGSDILKTYSFYQGVLTTDDAAAKASKKIVDINIPKDYVVKDASVGTVAKADEPYEGAVVGDKYIDLAINTNDGAGTGTVRHLYIPFKDLMDAVKGSVGAEITVAVSSDNTISATINKVSATKVIYKEAAGQTAEVTVKDALDIINGSDATEGSIKKAVKDGIDALDANTLPFASFTAGTAGAADTIVINGGVKEVNGVIADGEGDTITIKSITKAQIEALFASGE